MGIGHVPEGLRELEPRYLAKRWTRAVPTPARLAVPTPELPLGLGPRKE